MLKHFWLSYDLGIDGDYDGLFEWLDEMGAIECGENLAVFKASISKTGDAGRAILNKIQKHARLRSRDRLYLVWREGSKVNGRFIHGRRRRSPWAGYAVTGAEGDSDVD